MNKTYVKYLKLINFHEFYEFWPKSQKWHFAEKIENSEIVKRFNKSKIYQISPSIIWIVYNTEVYLIPKQI